MKKYLFLTLLFITIVPIQIHAMKEDNPLLTRIKEERIETIPEFMEVVRLLGEGKPFGDSILHDAVALGQYKIVKQLLTQGINANIPNYVDGTPPLLRATRTDIAELLVSHGARVNITNKHGDTSLHSGPARYLPEMTEWFITHKVDVNVVNKQEETPLHKVCRKGCAEKLLAHGAKLDVIDSSRNMPLHNAASNGYADIVELFLKSNANIHAQGYAESTPLHQAALNGQMDAAGILVKKGADTGCKDFFDMTPAQCAKQNGHSELAKILRSAAKK